MGKFLCPVCGENKGFNTGSGNGKLTCSNCDSTFPVDRLVEEKLSKKYQKKYNLYSIAADPVALAILQLLQTEDLVAMQIRNKMKISHATIFGKLETLVRVKAIIRSKYRMRRSRDGKDHTEFVYRAFLKGMIITTTFDGHPSKEEVVV